ncbi:MAG: WbqC family protein [Bacteroidota bacterium]
MLSPVLSIQYFGNIYFYHIINHNQNILFENSEYFIKQTLRNRTYILTANGVMPLIVPVKHYSHKEIISQKEICYKEKWYKKHCTAIYSAYKNAPYFEYYADEILNFLKHPTQQYLFEFNLQIMQTIIKILDLNISMNFTHQYQKFYENDLRFISNKYLIDNLPDALEKPYLQVFSDRFSFQKNLSVLDLIFNLGPDTKNYLLGKFHL